MFARHFARDGGGSLLAIEYSASRIFNALASSPASSLSRLSPVGGVAKLVFESESAREEETNFVGADLSAKGIASPLQIFHLSLNSGIFTAWLTLRPERF